MNVSGETQSNSRDVPAELRSTIANDGVKIQYEVLGSGAPLVLLHGGFAGRFTFSRQRAFADRYRLILPSSRGHDGTDGTLPSGFGFDTTEVEDVVSVLNAEAFESINLVGHSSGGATAFALASRLPKRVSKLVLIEPSLFALLPSDAFEKLAHDYHRVLERGARDGSLALLRGTLDLLGGDAWNKLDEMAKGSRLQAMAPMASLVAPHALSLLAVKISDEAVRSLRPKTLVIYGTASYDFEPAILQRFKVLRPDLESIIVEGAGHNVHRDGAEIVNAAIDRFLPG